VLVHDARHQAAVTLSDFTAVCAWLAITGCSLEQTSGPTMAVDASSEASVPAVGSSSGPGGAGGQGTGGAQGGSGNGGSATGGSNGGSTPGIQDASADIGPATREAGDDATADAADAHGECAGLFCEDFELGQIDSAKWNVMMTGGATVAIEQQVVAHGQHAVHFHSLGPPSGAALPYVYLLTKSVPSSLSVHNFGRAYFYMTPKPTSINIGLLFGGTSGFPRPTYMSVASHSGGWQLGFIKQQGTPAGEVQAYPVDVMPVAKWMCLEWEFNDQPDVIAFWRDGNAVGTLDPNHINYPPGHMPGAPLYNGMNSGLIGAFTDFGFGFYDWHPGNFPFDVYYDDIVLDTKRVGCL
jgi:hypothetical protein